MTCCLTAANSAAECLRLIGAHGGRGWLLGGGWEPALFPGGAPTAAALDEVTGDRPAYLVNCDHHSAWVNSAALRLAGVDERTPDPADGWIERDESGRPTGTLHEGATALVARVLPEPEPGEYAAALADAQQLLPGISEYELVESAAGLRPGTDDNLPVIGHLEAGVLAATGHHRGGFLLAPLTAEAVLALLRGGEPAAEVKAADPGRWGGHQ